MDQAQCHEEGGTERLELPTLGCSFSAALRCSTKAGTAPRPTCVPPAAAAPHGPADKRTALHISAAEGNLQAVRLLLEEGRANPGVVDRWGYTPVDEAVRVQVRAVVVVVVCVGGWWWGGWGVGEGWGGGSMLLLAAAAAAHSGSRQSLWLRLCGCRCAPVGVQSFSGCILLLPAAAAAAAAAVCGRRPAALHLVPVPCGVRSQWG